MDDWLGPVGRTSTFTLRDTKGRVVATAVGNVQGNEPATFEPHGATGPLLYPIYEIVTVNGIVEVIEHRRTEPTFYITDDPEIRRKLGVRP